MSSPFSLLRKHQKTLLVIFGVVAMITFTGSQEVGVRLREIAGLKRVTLELGSNSAVILEEDADLDLRPKQRRSGEPSRDFVGRPG